MAARKVLAGFAVLALGATIVAQPATASSITTSDSHSTQLLHFPGADVRGRVSQRLCVPSAA